MNGNDEFWWALVRTSMLFTILSFYVSRVKKEREKLDPDSLWSRSSSDVSLHLVYTVSLYGPSNFACELALSGSRLVVPPRAWQKETQIYNKSGVHHPRLDKSPPIYFWRRVRRKKKKKKSRWEVTKKTQWGKTCRNNKKNI